MKLQSRLLF